MKNKTLCILIGLLACAVLVFLLNSERNLKNSSDMIVDSWFDVATTNEPQLNPKELSLLLKVDCPPCITSGALASRAAGLQSHRQWLKLTVDKVENLSVAVDFITASLVKIYELPVNFERCHLGDSRLGASTYQPPEWWSRVYRVTNGYGLIGDTSYGGWMVIDEDNMAVYHIAF